MRLFVIFVYIIVRTNAQINDPGGYQYKITPNHLVTHQNNPLQNGATTKLLATSNNIPLVHQINQQQAHSNVPIGGNRYVAPQQSVFLSNSFQNQDNLQRIQTGSTASPSFIPPLPASVTSALQQSKEQNNFQNYQAQQPTSSYQLNGYNNAGTSADIGSRHLEKNIYVHLPSQASEQSLYQPPPQLPPRKHYKIILVKSPSPPSRPAAHLAVQPVEEKTLVYVLVKKPDSPSLEELQTVQQSIKSSKPEVYFIKYKTSEKNKALKLQPSTETVDESRDDQLRNEYPTFTSGVTVAQNVFDSSKKPSALYETHLKAYKL